MGIKRLRKWLLPAIFFVSFSGCAPKAPANEVRIGFFPNITHAQALYGKNTGAFRDAFGEDVNVKWLEFNAGPAEVTAMFAGEVDIGYIGPIPAINAFLTSSGDVRVIAGASNGGAVMVTRPGLILESVSQLDGLKVAIPQFGNTQHISLLNILRENNLAATDKGGTVEVLQAENADIKTLLDQGTIDAALVPEPWGARLINEIGAHIFLDEKQIWRGGDYPVAVIIVNKDFMDKNPQAVDKFMETHTSITETINGDFAAAQTVINDELLALTQSALTPEVLAEAFSRVEVTTDINEDVMDEFLILLADEGFADTAGPLTDLVVKGGQ